MKAGGSPFFAFVNCKTAHNPYNPPRPYKQQFDDRLDRPRFEFVERTLDRLGRDPQRVQDLDEERLRQLSWQYPILADEIDPTEEEIDMLTAWYDGAIRYLDQRIGNLVQFMRTQELFEETYVIITADHGELFGEHGVEKHHYSLYEPVLHVPLIISPAKESLLSRGLVSGAVSLIDLYPTILDIGDVNRAPLPNAQSLIGLDESSSGRYIYAEVGSKSPGPIQRHYPSFDGEAYDGPLQCVRDDEYKLIRSVNGDVELYRWRVDPTEQENIADSEPDVVERLIAAIERDLKPMGETALNEDIDDPELEKHLEDLGYL
jgi:arylsulfatase A-like enzyme